MDLGTAMGFIGAAAMAGLVGSPHCIGMCGGLASSCAGTLTGSLNWHAGRITTYAFLGALAGTFGSMIPGPTWVLTGVSGLLLIWFAAALAGMVPEPRFRLPFVKRAGTGLAGKEGLAARYLFGITTGFLPCGLVYAALSIPVASGHPVTGAASMAAFGVGTVPALATFTMGLRRLVARSLLARRLLAAAVLIAGVWTIGMRQIRGGHMEQGSTTGHPMEVLEVDGAEGPGN